MIRVITSERIPIKCWLDDIEDGALEQAKNLANLPFAQKWVGLMSDCHRGFGFPIGGVLLTKNEILPFAVGSDIGCGMCAVKTSLTDIPRHVIKKIFSEIRKVIPVGYKHQAEKQSVDIMPTFVLDKDTYCRYDKPLEKFLGDAVRKEYPIVSREWEKALSSLGSLGSGNHFIEIQRGRDGYIWIMLHSGSRNLGKQVADYYNKVAVDLNAKWYSAVPKKWDLAFLPFDSDEGKAYYREMNYCVEYAYANRKLMMDRIKGIFAKVLSNDILFETMKILRSLDESEILEFEPMINIAHNYAVKENHYGQNYIVHRKGATLAREGTIGIIPGSQGTPSYIVRGKGNKESFMSCSHGAGRRMGRKQAIRSLDFDEEVRKLDELGIVHSVRTVDDLDECSGAYKDIKTVLEQQEDLVEILVELKPLGVVKG